MIFLRILVAGKADVGPVTLGRSEFRLNFKFCLMSDPKTNVQFSPFNGGGTTSCTDSGFKAETSESKNNYNV